MKTKWILLGSALVAFVLCALLDLGTTGFALRYGAAALAIETLGILFVLQCARGGKRVVRFRLSSAITGLSDNVPPLLPPEILSTTDLFSDALAVAGILAVVIGAIGGLKSDGHLVTGTLVAFCAICVALILEPLVVGIALKRRVENHASCK